MKAARIIGIIAAALVLGVAAFFLYEKKRTSKPQAVCCGTLDVYPSFESAIITPRKVSVWLPDGYRVGESCDVLYMHDGQMLFDSTATWNHQEWQVDEILSKLTNNGAIRRTIVVAIDNTPDRLKEYFPDKACQGLENVDASELGGDNYLKFLVEEVKPFIDERYQPLTGREHTFLMGSSMGGLISLYGLCEYPEVFGGAACLSTHVSMSHLKAAKDTEAMADGFLRYVTEHMPDANEARIYMDHGTEGIDSAYGPYQERLDALFRERGWDARHFKSLVFEGHDHNETCWAKRLAEPMTFLLRNPSFQPFTFVQMSDPQIGFIDESPSYAHSDSLMKAAVDAVNALKPACVIVTGDLVNDATDPQQDAVYQARLSEIDAPVYATPGNHDYLRSSREAYLALRGYDRFSIREGGCAFIGMDSNCIKEGMANVEADQRAWLEKELSAAKACRYTFVFLHCPVIRERIDEPEDYFNFSMEKRREYIDLFKAYGVDVVFAGHTHQEYDCTIEGIRFVAAGPVGNALGHGTPGYNVVHVGEDGVEVTFTPTPGIDPARCRF